MQHKRISHNEIYVNEIEFGIFFSLSECKILMSFLQFFVSPGVHTICINKLTDKISQQYLYIYRQ